MSATNKRCATCGETVPDGTCPDCDPNAECVTVPAARLSNTLRTTGIYQISEGDILDGIGQYEYHEGDDVYAQLTETPDAREWEEIERDGMTLLAVTDRFGDTFLYELPR